MFSISRLHATQKLYIVMDCSKSKHPLCSCCHTYPTIHHQTWLEENQTASACPLHSFVHLFAGIMLSLNESFRDTIQRFLCKSPHSLHTKSPRGVVKVSTPKPRSFSALVRGDISGEHSLVHIDEFPCENATTQERHDIFVSTLAIISSRATEPKI
jgi:hypothetical protein